MGYIQDRSSKSVKEHSLNLKYPTFSLLFCAIGNNDILEAGGNTGALKNRTQMYFSDTFVQYRQWKENKI